MGYDDSTLEAISVELCLFLLENGMCFLDHILPSGYAHPPLYALNRSACNENDDTPINNCPPVAPPTPKSHSLQASDPSLSLEAWCFVHNLEWVVNENIDKCPRLPSPIGCCGSCGSVGEGDIAYYYGEELRVYNYSLHFSNYSALKFWTTLTVLMVFYNLHYLYILKMI